MLKNKILQEFLNSYIKITSQEKLEQYIEYCIFKNQNTKHKSDTHHILPKADDCFPQFKDLKLNIWNKSELLYEDHYTAHELLVQAIDNSSMNYSYQKMSERLTKDGKIEYIDSGLFGKIKEKAVKENAQKRKLTINNMKEQGIYEDWVDEWNQKRQASLNELANNGKTIRENAMKTRTENVIKEFIDENGEITTIAKLGGAKAAATRRKPIVNEDGEISTIDTEAGKKGSKTLNKEVFDEESGTYMKRKDIRKRTIANNLKLKPKKSYMLYKGDSLIGKISIKTCNNISGTLKNKTKDKTLIGDRKQDIEKAERNGKGMFRGVYMEYIGDLVEDDTFLNYEEVKSKC